MFIMRTRNQWGREWCGLMESDWDKKLQQPRKRTIASLARIPRPLIDAMDAALK